MNEILKIEKDIIAQLDQKIVQPKELRSQELEKLEAIQFPIDQFSWKGRAIFCSLIKIIDGDTISVAIYDRNHAAYTENCLVQLNIRLFGIDTPEKSPRTDDVNRIAIKMMAAESHQHLQKILQIDGDSNRIFTLLFLQDDKYGRPLAIIYRDDGTSIVTMQDAWLKSFNKKMIDDGYALPYNGGTKWNFALAQKHYFQSRLQSHLLRVSTPQKTLFQKFCDLFRK